MSINNENNLDIERPLTKWQKFLYSKKCQIILPFGVVVLYAIFLIAACVFCMPSMRVNNSRGYDESWFRLVMFCFPAGILLLCFTVASAIIKNKLALKNLLVLKIASVSCCVFIFHRWMKDININWMVCLIIILLPLCITLFILEAKQIVYEKNGITAKKDKTIEKTIQENSLDTGKPLTKWQKFLYSQKSQRNLPFGLVVLCWITAIFQFNFFDSWLYMFAVFNIFAVIILLLLTIPSVMANNKLIRIILLCLRIILAVFVYFWAFLYPIFMSGGGYHIGYYLFYVPILLSIALIVVEVLQIKHEKREK